MLTAAGCQARRERLWRQLSSQPAAILLHDPKSLIYLANYWQTPFEFRSNDARAALILTPDGRSVLIADNLLGPFTRQAHVDEVIAPIWYHSQDSPPHRQTFLAQNVRQQVAKFAPGTAPLGVEASTVPLAMLSNPAQATIDIDPILTRMRQCKDEDEIDLLRLSVQAGEAGMAAARREIRPGMTELEVYRLVEQAACSAINRQVIVYGDFVAGTNTEKGGGPPSTRRINQGELVLLDFSVVVWGYRADFATSFVCHGSPSSELQERHQACLEALSAGEAKLRAGVRGQEVYHAVRAAFAMRQMEKYFPHHAGHGLGLGHPEAPFLVPASAEALAIGNVVTLEPGLYQEGIGGMRFERNYLLSATGYVTLTHHSLALEQVP